MNKKLEKATEILIDIKDSIDWDCKENIEMRDAIEIVLQALENYKIKELQFLNSKLDNVSAVELQIILRPYYIQKEELKHKDKLIEQLKCNLENSISKEVIEEKIDKYKQRLRNNTKRVAQLQVLEQNGVLQQSEWEELNMLFGDIEKTRGKIEALQDLLEGK